MPGPYTRDTMSPNIEIHLLGDFAIRHRDGRSAGPWPRPTGRRLVQLLCVSPGRRRRRDEVAEALFPGLAPFRSANAVAKAISMVRSAVGRIGVDPASFLTTDRSMIRIGGGDEVVIDLEEHLATLAWALSAPPGDDRDTGLVDVLRDDRQPLEEEAYADWAIAAREALAARRLEGWLALARDRAAGHGHSDPDSVIGAWTEVIAREPTSEEAAIGLIRAFAERGQRDRAIRAYLRCVAALRDQLGVPPSEELLHARAVLDQTAARSRPADAGTAALAARPLVGRGPILARLERRLQRTPIGHGPAILLLGPAGVGKTHLAGAVAAERRRDGWTVLSGAAVPGDDRVPYAALAVALRPVVRESRTENAWVRQLVEGLPGNGRGDGDPEMGLAALAAELTRVLDDLAADRPLLVHLDDIHWADRALTGLVRRLAASPARRRWALLLAARSDEPTHRPPSLGSAVDVIELGPLTEGGTRRAVRVALQADGIRVHRQVLDAAVGASHGNPFFAIELARGLVQRVAEGRLDPTALRLSTGLPGHDGEPIPGAIVALLSERLASMAPTARAMIPLVAMAGEDATYEVLLGAFARLGTRPEDAQSGLEALLESRQVVESGDHLSLAHPLLRDAALASTNALRRSGIHTAIADELESLDPALPGSRRDAVANHRLDAFEAAHLRVTAARAAESGFEAGSRARRLMAAEAATRLIAGALAAYSVLAAGDRARLRERAVHAWILLGDIALDRDDDRAAEDAYRSALTLADRDGERALGWAALAGIRYRHGDMIGAAETLDGALDSLADGDPLARARLQSDLAWCRYRSGDAESARALLDQILPTITHRSDVELRCRTLDRLGVVLWSSGRHEDALAVLDQGLADAIDAEPAQELSIRTHRASALEVLGRTTEATEDIAIAARLADAIGDAYMRSVIHWSWAELLDGRGETRAALAERDAEIVILARIGNPRNLVGAQVHRAVLLADLGATDAAMRAVRAARAAADGVADAAFRERATTRIQVAMERIRQPPTGHNGSRGNVSGTPTP